MVFSDMYWGSNSLRFLITYYWQAWKLLRLIQGSFILYSSKRSLVIVQTVLNLVYVSMVFSDM